MVLMVLEVILVVLEVVLVVLEVLLELHSPSVRDENETYNLHMNPSPSGLVWGWIWGPSRANLGVKLAMLGRT